MFKRAPAWFWLAFAVGVAIRIYLVVFTKGTYDVNLWQENARGVSEQGLIGYYHSDPKANHPPLMFEVESLVWRAAQASGIPFRILLRAPFAVVDAACAALLLNLLSSHRWRFGLVAIYWLNPLSMILSSYQGNTDFAVAFSLLLSVWFLSKEKFIVAAIAVGAGLCLKLPGVIAIPALVFYLKGWRQRLRFLFIVGVVALIGFFPGLLGDPNVIARNVFGYHGGQLQTHAGVPAWGWRVLFFSLIAAPEHWPETLHAPVMFIIQNSWRIALACSLALSLLWIRRDSIAQLCVTIAIVYLPIYGLSDFWAFQYFSWALPFWFFLRPWFFVGATFVGSAYLYSLYWKLCGNGYLVGEWDFAGNLYWPVTVIAFRNLAFLFFFLCAVGFLIAAICQLFTRLRLRWASATVE